MKRIILTIIGVMVLIIFISGFLLSYVISIDFSAEVSAAIIAGCISIVAILVSTLINVYFNFQNEKLTLRDRIYEKRIEAYDKISVIVQNSLFIVVMAKQKTKLNVLTKEEIQDIIGKIQEYPDSLRALMYQYFIYLPSNIINHTSEFASCISQVESSLRNRLTDDDRDPRLTEYDACIEQVGIYLYEMRRDLGLDVLDQAIRKALAVSDDTNLSQTQDKYKPKQRPS